MYVFQSEHRVDTVDFLGMWLWVVIKV